MLVVWLPLLVGATPPEPYEVIIEHALAAAEARARAPLALTDDAAFLRRVSLDLSGRLPSAAEAEAFLSDRSPTKRAKKIDELLDRPASADAFADVWSEVLLGPLDPARERRINREHFAGWLADAWRQDRPWDQVVTDLLTASGSADVSGPASFILAQDTTEALTGQIGRVLLGVGLQCAECHDHPEQSITRQDFYGIAAFFGRSPVRMERLGATPRAAPAQLSGAMVPPMETMVVQARQPGAAPYRRPVITDAEVGEMRVPDGPRIRPRFLTGERPPRGDGHAQRLALAQLITARDGGYLARATVDRLWGQYLGGALVEPAEDLGVERCPPAAPAASSAPAAAPGAALLCDLAGELARRGFQLRPLIRAILRSRAYQADTKAWSGAHAQAPALAIRRVKPLSPAQLYQAVLDVTGAPRAFPAPPLRQADPRARAVAGLGMLIGAGEDGPGEAPIATVPLALLMMNGPRLNRALEVRRGTALDALFAGATSVDRVRRLFLSTLTRPPSPAESSAFVAALDSAGGRPKKAREVYADEVWALFNSTEFMYAR